MVRQKMSLEYTITHCVEVSEVLSYMKDLYDFLQWLIALS